MVQIYNDHLVLSFLFFICDILLVEDFSVNMQTSLQIFIPTSVTKYMQLA